ncbi:unnamed protein product [Taenia asiatica]|uniref:Peptidase_M16 domain-containing protein n=1 Tax=Taenia asiatica TaxID=60517 RepID=A0A0R3VYX2_TAEAS|nr:unnamed protein product [Taenia asiatica]
MQARLLRFLTPTDCQLGTIRAHLNKVSLWPFGVAMLGGVQAYLKSALGNVRGSSSAVSRLEDIFEVNKSKSRQGRAGVRRAPFIHLKNGLRTMLISSLKPGETAESETDSVSDAWDECEEEEAICHDDEVSKVTMRKSAAALCVNVGYFTDPVEAQGLAHFLEHMVFMGSEKYPRENDFDDYVEHRGGSSNACTDGDYTLFFFDIQRAHFEEALDKFANFFIAPLLSQDCVDRELEAIHSGWLNSSCAKQMTLAAWITF